MWTLEQAVSLQFGTSPKKKKERTYWRTQFLTVPYLQLINQFMCELDHGHLSGAYEAQHRWSYVVQVMNAFGDELMEQHQLENDGPHVPAWHSKVLTPILQRQLNSVSDVYAPALRVGISPDGSNGSQGDNEGNDEKPMTIAEATKYYLGDDPLHPKFLKMYLQNLVFVREMRWHLAILAEQHTAGDENFFDQTLTNQDYVLEEPDEIGLAIDHLSPRERAILAVEGIYDSVRDALGIVSP